MKKPSVERELVRRYTTADWPEAMDIRAEWEQLYFERIEHVYQERWNI